MNNSRSPFGGNIPPITLNLIIINVLVWLAQVVFLRQGIDISQYLGLHYFTNNFKIYQLVSYMFLHDTSSFMHVFSNMFAVFMFGRTIEQVWGSKRFITYYMITGIGAGLTQLLITYLHLQSPLVISIGASGAVFGILLAFGMLFPNAKLFIIPIPFPIKAKYFVVGYGFFELYYGVRNFAWDNVAHFAHLGGMVFGIFMILYWKKKGKNYGEFY